MRMTGYHAKFGSYTSNGFSVYSEYRQETQLSLTNRATHLCKCNGVADLPKTSPSQCVLYHGEFGRSALKGMGINTGESQNWEH